MSVTDSNENMPQAEYENKNCNKILSKNSKKLNSETMSMQ